MSKLQRVIFRPKSFLQKDDCIFPGCEDESTLEAVTAGAQVRCCENQRHMKHAAKLARMGSRTFGKLHK